jgi:transposase
MGLKHSKFSPRQQGELIKLFIVGSTARTAAELVGIHRNSAALYFRKLRELIAAHQEREMRQAFGGEVEIDESYFGDLPPERVLNPWVYKTSPIESAIMNTMSG